MASETNTVSTIIPAIIGFVGVLVGSLISILKDWITTRAKKKKNLEYLAARVITALDEFAERCAGVSGDDGTCFGQPNHNGCYVPQTSVPEINFHELDVEWTTLPGYLLYEIMNFPNEVAAVNRYLSDVFDVAGPPFDDYMEERQYEYAKLGVTANHYASKLRMQVGFPTREIFKWDSVTYMEDQIIKIEQRKANLAQAAKRL